MNIQNPFRSFASSSSGLQTIRNKSRQLRERVSQSSRETQRNSASQNGQVRPQSQPQTMREREGVRQQFARLARENFNRRQNETLHFRHENGVSIPDGITSTQPISLTRRELRAYQNVVNNYQAHQLSEFNAGDLLNTGSVSSNDEAPPAYSTNPNNFEVQYDLEGELNPPPNYDSNHYHVPLNLQGANISLSDAMAPFLGASVQQAPSEPERVKN